MWIDTTPVNNNWHGGAIRLSQVLYEYDGPVVFRATIGLNDYLFAKRDEIDGNDYYLAVETDDAVISALSQGRISLRGALHRGEGWLIEGELDNVSAFQHIPEVSIDRFLPAQNVGLRRAFGILPDTMEQAEAFIAFRFLGRELRKGVVPLSALKGMVDEFALFVRRALTPPALNVGRDYRFFDLPMIEPKFSSLVLAANKPEFTDEGIQQSPRLKDVDPNYLIEQAGERGNQFWNALELANDLINENGVLSGDFIAHEREFLESVAGLMPSQKNALDRVEITLNDGLTFRTLLLNRFVGETIAAAADTDVQGLRTITGVIMEVNGDAQTFIIKDITQRQTTCKIPNDVFDQLDVNGELRRGRQLSITGNYDRRTRRGWLWTDQPIQFLN